MWWQRVSFLTIRMVLNHITVNKNVLSASLNKTCPSFILPLNEGARCSSTVEHPLMVQWVVRSIPHGGPIELFRQINGLMVDPLSYFVRSIPSWWTHSAISSDRFPHGGPIQLFRQIVR